MHSHVAFLRAINVGGHTVKMDRLKTIFVSMGFESVQTVIASGNVLFQTKKSNAGELESLIEKTLKVELSYEVATFVRTANDVARIAGSKPFAKNLLEKAMALNVIFLREELTAENQRKVMGLKSAMDHFSLKGREIFWLCLKKQSESEFSNAIFEKELKVHSTFRGMKTVQRIASALQRVGPP